MKTDKIDELKGMVLEIQRMSTEDGPGLRTTVFFKGCTLKCAWCHNPESISAKPEIQWLETKCIGCGTCVDVCPEGALSLTDGGIVIDRGLCTGCGECAHACPSTAMELLGTEWEVSDLVREVLKDRSYFGGEGGVTASGGEATMQSPFVAEFFKLLKEEGIHTALDTCGQSSRSTLERILPYTDLVLFDLKLMDIEAHQRYTGSGTDTIHENLRYIIDYMEGHLFPSALKVRTPVIPGATDTEDNVRAIARFITEECGSAVAAWELCTFNNLCRDKYLRLGMVWEFSESPLLTRERMEELTTAAREALGNPGLVFWSGSVRLDDTEREKPEKSDILNVILRGGCTTWVL